MNFKDEAIKKLRDECKSGSFATKAAAMKTAVCDALITFCEQDYEFAQAVAQGGSFSKCMEAVARNVGSSISDLEAFKRAVQFYFDGAEVVFQMKIDVCPNRVGGGDGDGIVLDLMNFM